MRPGLQPKAFESVSLSLIGANSAAGSRAAFPVARHATGVLKVSIVQPDVPVDALLAADASWLPEPRPTAACAPAATDELLERSHRPTHTVRLGVAVGAASHRRGT